ncbi:hypothetical protein BDZ90DRAFT_229814 [Jaminaea rosea]|uniref:Uncharacterized protein n=1 Tax=Jaminaea rosea TaxID=1569628 RepID=A0A316V5V9_9BASI|nr:hypothetical protein BDZ90DRAFT_229814 [Jaminaea rosea]PWN30815.1 hypothetical protein BDZ90DRAFT_229814 [Jaminaea rosea]
MSRSAPLSLLALAIRVEVPADGNRLVVRPVGGRRIASLTSCRCPRTDSALVPDQSARTPTVDDLSNPPTPATAHL